jgi:hypothetical protein
MQENYALKRKEAYNKAKKMVEIDLKDNLLRDFINIYIGEGDKRNNTRIYKIIYKINYNIKQNT